jgi:hypothetical protein
VALWEEFVRHSLTLLFCASLAVAGLHGSPADAQMLGQLGASADAAEASVPSNQYSPSHRFFVEFRARSAASYGHMYVMYGEVNARHEVIRSEIAGFFPAGDSRNCQNCSVYNWTIGHVIPVPSEIGASDGDLEEQYVTARYRVWIDADQYKRLVAYINDRKAHLGLWHVALNNCVTFGKDIAVILNLNIPPLMRIAPVVVMYPQYVVEWIRDANGGEKDQGPLEDAPGSLPAEVIAELHAKSPTKTIASTNRTGGTTASTEKPAVTKKQFANKREESNASSAIH